VSDDGSEEEDNNEEDTVKYFFEGVEYPTYQEMVNAKRKRNERVLMDSGLLELTASYAKKQKKAAASQRGLTKRQKLDAAAAALPRRKSSRLAGIQSDGLFVEEEFARGRVSVGSSDGKNISRIGKEDEEEGEEPEFYRNRINDGSSLAVREAVENIADKWLDEGSVASAENFVRFTLGPLVDDDVGSAPPSSPRTAIIRGNRKKLQQRNALQRLDQLKADQPECVAKVVPDRIYGIAAHPSQDQMIVCAGDKSGYVGIWNADHQPSIATPSTDERKDNGSSDDGVHLFRFHNGAASCLEWTRDGSSLLSASYDGTVRLFNVRSESFEQVFGTFDSDVKYKNELGYKMDTGYKFWTQYACLDRRSSNSGSNCSFFLSTSVGTAAHVDLRTKGRVTFYEQLSEKKVNTVRYVR